MVCLHHQQTLTLNVRGPSYLGLTRSISWLLMPWLFTSPGHQQPWYWLYRICRSFSYLRKCLNTCVKSMWRNDIKCKYMFMFPQKNLACKELIWALPVLYCNACIGHQFENSCLLMSPLSLHPSPSPMIRILKYPAANKAGCSHTHNSKAHLFALLCLMWRCFGDSRMLCSVNSRLWWMTRLYFGYDTHCPYYFPFRKSVNHIWMRDIKFMIEKILSKIDPLYHSNIRVKNLRILFLIFSTWCRHMWRIFSNVQCTKLNIYLGQIHPFLPNISPIYGNTMKPELN